VLAELRLRYAARSVGGPGAGDNKAWVHAGVRVLAIACGFGPGGEVAAQLMISALAKLEVEAGGDLSSKLKAAVVDGNAAIAKLEPDPDLEPRGVTVTAILFGGHQLGVVHIGASRGYLLRDGELTQLTRDDTLVQDLVDKGRITAEAAARNPYRRLLARALQGGHEVQVMLITREACAGDRYLVCSSALWDPLSHTEIQATLQMPDVARSAERLVELALDAGGPDEVAVVVAEVVSADSAAGSHDEAATSPPAVNNPPHTAPAPARPEQDVGRGIAGDSTNPGSDGVQ
jgi:serine/threonine protein phosphatase PrpC